MTTRNGKRLNGYIEDNDNDNDNEIAGPSTEGTDLENSAEPPAKRPRNLPKIFNGIFYIVQKETDGNIQAECTTCGEIRKGNISSTGNFISHYKKMHPSKLKELKDSIKIESDNVNKKSHQPTLAEFSQSITADSVSSKILHFIIDGNLSFNIAQLPSLRDLLESVSGRKVIIPSRPKFVKTLNDEFSKTKAKLKEVLAKQKYLCLTADVWSSRAQSYLGVTVHFLNRETFKRESFVLAFKQMHFKQTYKELAKAMYDIFDEYGINKTQITNIVTDGGSAFCKMFKMFGSSIDAAVSTYNSGHIEDFEELDELEDLDDTNLKGMDNVTTFMEDSNGEQFVNEVLQFSNNNLSSAENEFHNSVEANSDNFLDSYLGGSVTNSTNYRIEMPPQRRCVLHLLHLTSQDFENKYLTGLAKAALIQSLSKLHTLFVFTRRSSRAKTICKAILGQCLKLPCETRWNSRYDAVKMCIQQEIRNKLNILIGELKSQIGQSAQNLQLLTNADFAVVIQYVKVLEPVANSLDVMQREINSSQGFIIPVLTSMKHRIVQIEDSSNIARDFKAAMIEAIDSRFSKYFVFNDSNKDLLLASVTFPRIKINFIAEDENIIFVKKLLIIECKELYTESSESIEVQQNVMNPVNDDDFIISFASRRDVRRNSMDNEIESEVSRFIFDARIEMSMLNEFPNVRKVFFKYNTTLASSAPVERVFSQSLMIFTPRRNRLSATLFEQTLLLKHNRMLLKESVKL